MRRAKVVRPMRLGWPLRACSQIVGTVYEKRLIEAYISENGVEPTTGEALTTEDLIELNTQRIVRPRPPTLTSIPSLLGVFQEEWDALALETFTLKKGLVETRQELSTALYQHDAAVRVIARLTKERDEARDALSKVNVGARTAPRNGDAMQVDSTGVPDAIIAKVERTQEAYVKPYTRFTICRLTGCVPGYRRHVENDQCQRIGLHPTRSPTSLPYEYPNHSIQVEKL